MDREEEGGRYGEYAGARERDGYRLLRTQAAGERGRGRLKGSHFVVVVVDGGGGGKATCGGAVVGGSRCECDGHYGNNLESKVSSGDF